MSWLVPLGFLGFLGILVLILIYILKPNFQQKIISSTYVWQLSLKYKKKRIPINRFRNILLFLCQILILTACALLLAQPIIPSEDVGDYPEKVLIIDASASMLTTSGGKTRFERAVEEAKSSAEDALTDPRGLVTLIVAGEKAECMYQRAGVAMRSDIADSLDSLVAGGNLQCSYGASDLDGAMEFAQAVVNENPSAEVVFFTGTNYLDKNKVTVVDVSDESEWNAAILDVRAVYSENYYSFEIDVASYDRPIDLRVMCDIYGVNDDGATIKHTETVRLMGMGTQTFVLDGSTDGYGIYKYDYVYVRFDEPDSLSFDNEFYLYGGTKQPLRIEYVSSASNSFFSAFLMGWRQVARTRWDIELREVHSSSSAEPELDGYDVYIFEHGAIPEMLPSDGLVILADPLGVPNGAGFTLGRPRTGKFNVVAGAHPILEYLRPENFVLSSYTSLASPPDAFDILMTCGGDPVLMCKKSEGVQLVVMLFSLNLSDVAVTEFPTLMRGILNYFLPSTLEKQVYEVNEVAQFNARGTNFTLIKPGETQGTVYGEVPVTVKLATPGTYSTLQTLLSGREAVESFFVRIPAAESNIKREVQSLEAPDFPPPTNPIEVDLLIYFAAALVALLFLEWWLQSRENF